MSGPIGGLIKPPVHQIQSTFYQKQPRKPPKQFQEFDDGMAAGLKAAGITLKSVSEVLDADQWGLSKRLKKYPDAISKIEAVRLRLRELSAVGALKASRKLWPRLEREIDTGDARDVDAISRAINAVEKTAVSVSGEALRVNVEGKVDTNPSVDLKLLIQNILGPPAGTTEPSPRQDRLPPAI